ncbi:M42 family metallopeptidase [Faecalimonas umbilicata]|uniref:M42 family metallopeptidase n=1 Tax=Faecalimonas umbilicata TaxID=1912855 RepID=UPI0022E832DC|nr:M42 family metallopeptidase [Faecalimonas umbilicata]
MAHQNHEYHEYIVEQTEKVIGIDSPTGYHYNVQKYLVDTIQAMGFEVRTLRKGGVIANLGGEGNPLMMLAHVDTLGAFVHYIKGNGRLAISNGTLNPNNIETENVRVITRSGAVYEGTIQLENASVHVNPDVNAERKFTNLEVVLDEDVTSKEDVEKLGICAGDFLAVEPRFQVTEKGYIKSRFLDDKASSGVLLGIAKYVSEHPGCLKRNVQLFFTTFEEIGHGASAGIPEEIEDLLAVDMGCVGDHLACTEKQVSICAKDSSGAYHFEMTNELIEVAKEHGIDYAVDIYPSYGSDAGAALRSGRDVRYALIGQGVYASHGYERTHKDGMKQTFELALNYVLK